MSAKKDGAFTKLMEWQMSGVETGAVGGVAPPGSEKDRDMAVSGEGGRGPVTEKEEIQHELDSRKEEEESEGDGEREDGRIEGSKAQEVVEHAVQKSGKK